MTMRRILIVFNLTLVALLTAGVAAVLWFSNQVPRLPDDLRELASPPETRVLGRDGSILGTLGGRSFYVSLDQISPHFLNAIVAAEDKRFRRHHGIDFIASARALWQNLRSPDPAPGGSTITQQLAKNLFFSFERSWRRKILEALAAAAIEERLSKDEILEVYCNFVDFGQYAFGIERASQVYFGKPARDLDLPEAALLAGIPKAPSRYNPFTDPSAARSRQRQVLKAMAHAGRLRSEQVDSLMRIPLRLRSPAETPPRGSYPVDYAVELARRTVGSEPVSYGGIRIFTTVDPALQDAAQYALESGLAALEARMRRDDSTPPLEGALVAVEVETGDVVALVGGRNYRRSPYNRAVKSRRPPGSAFKPVVYLAALDAGLITPVTVKEDKPLKLPLSHRRFWSPDNFDDRYLGPVTMKMALMKSINTIAAQIAAEVGPEQVVAAARKLGVTSPLEPHLSLALGSQGVTPLEMAAVFTALARLGNVVEPRAVSVVEGPGGHLQKEFFAAGESRFEPEVVYELVDMLSGVLEPGGTGASVRRMGFTRTAFAKTGTSGDHRDCWFCGATPRLAVAVWVGYDDNRPLLLADGSGVTGAVGAAPIWTEFMMKAESGFPDLPFAKPIGLQKAFVEPYRGTVSPDSAPGYIPVTLRNRPR